MQPKQSTQSTDYLTGHTDELVVQKIASFLPTKDLMKLAQVNHLMAIKTKRERDRRKLEMEKEKETFRPITSLTTIDYSELSRQQENLFRRCRVLPNCLKLTCICEQLTRLPDLPVCQELVCFDNHLTQLPDLPKCRQLMCFDNHLTQLPDLPMCQQLSCNYNQLTRLSNLPVSNIIVL